jgi:hypothetical protein
MTVDCPVGWLLLLHAAMTLFMVGVIWFVQVGDLPHPGDLLQPAVELGATEKAGVWRRLGLRGRGAQLVLIGKDGGIKAQQSEGGFDLERLFALIDSMPMRRAEMGQR